MATWRAWYFFAPIGFGGAMSLWAVVVNRQSGLALLGSELRLFAGRWSRTIPTNSIESASIKQWSDGAPTVTLMLRDGETVDVPAHCLGSENAFTAALLSRGIPTVRT